MNLKLSRILFRTPVRREWLKDDSDVQVNIHLDEVYFGLGPHLGHMEDGTINVETMVEAILTEDLATAARTWHFIEYD